MAVRIELNRRAIRDLLSAPAVTDDLRNRAQRVASAAGPGHRVEVSDTGSRARAAVITETIPAMIREGRDRNLTRAFDTARG